MQLRQQLIRMEGEKRTPSKNKQVVQTEEKNALLQNNDAYSEKKADKGAEGKEQNPENLPASGGGPDDKGKNKISFKNILKNTTRGIGRFVRKLPGRRDLIPMGNIQNRKATINFIYNAPDFKEGEDKDDPEHKSGYANYKNIDGASVTRYIKKSAGKEDNGRTDWDASGDFDPDKREEIEKFTRIKMTFDSWADPDYFALINLDTHKGETKVCTDKDLKGSFELGKSHSGYEAQVKSLKGVTKAPNNSNWSYTIEAEMKVWVPYSEDVDHKEYEQDYEENKRPWWHSFWYGHGLPVKSKPVEDK